MTWDHPHLTEEQWNTRVAEVEAEERNLPEAWHWMSFAEDGPLGVVVLQARGILHATRKTSQLGINPGGEIMLMKFDTPMSERMEALLLQHRDRLLTKDEAMALDTLLAG